MSSTKGNFLKKLNKAKILKQSQIESKYSPMVYQDSNRLKKKGEREREHTILQENQLLAFEVVVERTVEDSLAVGNLAEGNLVEGTPVEDILVEGTLEEDRRPSVDTLYIIHNNNNKNQFLF